VANERSPTVAQLGLGKRGCKKEFMMSIQNQNHDQDLMLDVGQANELKLAFCRAGWTNDEIKALCKDDILSKVLEFVKSQAEIECLIDCDIAPFVPDGWTVEEHIPGGQLDFSSAKVKLYLAKKQKEGFVVGNDLRKELRNKSVMNANVLDWYLAHSKKIPNAWKGKYVFFWGTIYRNADGVLYVRCLYWDGNQWDWNCSWLDSNFYSNSPAAVANFKS
jgi:hypothetical protein